MKYNNENNNKNIAKNLFFLVLLVFLFSGCSENSNSNISEENINQIENNQINNDEVLPSISNSGQVKKKYTILMSNEGFSPKSLEIKKGDSVVFLNSGDDRHWPASNVHPTHTQYPGSGIEKCGTVDEYKIFDACRSIKAGENYTFTFNEVGTWSYHDHVHSTLKGTIIVKE